MQGQSEDARSVSAALFNNASFTEVLSAAHKILAVGDGRVTTRQVAAATGRGDSVVRPIMKRLVDAGLLLDPGPTRGARPFTRAAPDLWRELLGVVSVVTGAPSSFSAAETRPELLESTALSTEGGARRPLRD